MKEQPRPVLLYVADLKRDGLIKVGSTKNRCTRLAQLRRQFGPQVEIFQGGAIPNGFGTPKSWEDRLIRLIVLPRHRADLENLDEQAKPTLVRPPGTTILITDDTDELDRRFSLMWSFNCDVLGQTKK